MNPHREPPTKRHEVRIVTGGRYSTEQCAALIAAALNEGFELLSHSSAVEVFVWTFVKVHQ